MDSQNKLNGSRTAETKEEQNIRQIVYMGMCITQEESHEWINQKDCKLTPQIVYE